MEGLETYQAPRFFQKISAMVPTISGSIFLAWLIKKSIYRRLLILK